MTGTGHAIHTPQLDHNTAFVLFVFTIIIHAVTMLFLESVSKTFQQYISATRGNTVESKRGSYTPTSASGANACAVPSLSTHTQYRPLHSTLDVSVFR